MCLLIETENQTLQVTCNISYPWVYDTKLIFIKFNTYLDFDLDRECDSECLEALDGLRDPDLLSDFTRAGLPAGDFDWERDS